MKNLMINEMILKIHTTIDLEFFQNLKNSRKSLRKTKITGYRLKRSSLSKKKRKREREEKKNSELTTREDFSNAVSQQLSKKSDDDRLVTTR